MRYIFFGTPRNSAILLERLIAAGLPPAALVANPDRPAGRKKIITPPATKQAAAGHPELGIKILQPERIMDTTPELLELGLDLGIVFAYGKILPPEILRMPKHGIIGVHPSLLPKYRGPSPIQSALLANEEETGVALYKMGPGLDDGPIYAMEKLAIGGMTHDELSEALANLAADMLIPLLAQMERGELPSPVVQDESSATFTRKFTAEDGFVAEKDLRAAEAGEAAIAAAIYGKIRAFTPEPGAWTLVGGKRLKLLRARMNGPKLELVTVQYEGGTPEDYRG